MNPSDFDVREWLVDIIKGKHQDGEKDPPKYNHRIRAAEALLQHFPLTDSEKADQSKQNAIDAVEKAKGN